jgi:quercetin dioxygenase-like cupin family protein
MPSPYQKYFPKPHVRSLSNLHIMAIQSQVDPYNGDLPAPLRHVTTHDLDGKSIFFKGLETKGQREAIRDDLDFYLQYSTSTFPVNLSDETDITQYQKLLQGEKPGLTNKGGTILRICSFAPGSTEDPPMHRTISLDFGIVVAGEMESILDSGEIRHLNVGDIVVQRQTNHAWRNPSPDKWARMVFVLQEAEPLKLGGKLMKEDYGGIPGVRSST